MALLQKSCNKQRNKIIGGMYFVNNYSSIIPDYKLITNPDIYFQIIENKLKYSRGKNNITFNIFWSISIKAKFDINISLVKNKEIISSKKFKSEDELVIGNCLITKLIINDELWLEVDNESIISSASILLSE